MSEETVTTVLGEEIKPAGDNQTNVDNQNIADQANDTDYLANFVGEGKQYSTVEEAAKALAKKAVNADQFIETLKQEKLALEQKASEGKTVDDIIAALNKEQVPDTTTQTDTNETVPQGLTVDKLEEWYVQREAKKAEAATTQAAVDAINTNQKKAWEHLSKSEAEGGYGSLENAKLAINKYVGNDPAKAEVVNNLGGYDPEGLSKFLKATVQTEAVNFSSDEGVVNTPSYGQTGALTWEKVKAAERENPKLKRDRKWNTYVNENLKF